MAASSSSAASGLLSRQLKQMQSDKDIPGISCGLVSDNVFEWEVMLMISDDCKYYGGTTIQMLLSPSLQVPSGLEWPIHILDQSMNTDNLLALTGGFYRAHLMFPPEYPLLPPKMVFQTPIFHPNGEPIYIHLTFCL